MRHEERETFRLHARLRAHKKRVAQSIEIIHRAMREAPGEWALGISGGKDSVAMLDVALEAGWRGPAYTFYYKETTEDQKLFVRATCTMLDVELHETQVIGAFDVYDEIGFFVDAETEEQKRAVNHAGRLYKKQATEFAAARGWAGMFWGLRAAESRPRLITLRKKGPIYRVKDRPYVTCCPLAWWSGLDVWARIVSRDLPYLPRYDAAEDRVRERSEETWLAAGKIWSNGAGARLRKTHPERWAELVNRWPELSRYG